MAEKRGVTKITPELESHTDSKTRKPVESTAFKLSARRKIPHNFSYKTLFHNLPDNYRLS